MKNEIEFVVFLKHGGGWSENDTLDRYMDREAYTKMIQQENDGYMIRQLATAEDYKCCTRSEFYGK